MTQPTKPRTPAKSRIPAGAPKPQDHQPKKSTTARQAEAEDGFVTVETCGMTLTIPVGGKVPLAAAIAFQKGDELGGTELLLGADQWAAFLEKNPTVDDFAEVGKQLEELTGN
ncbi:adenylosuccinate synthase [Mycobacterium sp. NPDC051198]